MTSWASVSPDPSLRSGSRVSNYLSDIVIHADGTF